VFGTRQHGLPPLAAARLPEDLPLLEMARRDASVIIEEDPRLTDDSHELLRKVLLQTYGEALGLGDVG
ncbi:MAG: hypothetical protein R3336_02695, partial [Phycisphaeraceae bacterium]|nr:hypothetical protein [Phycisphaeraceae bacterium]